MTEYSWPFGPYPQSGLRRLGPHVVAYHGDAFPFANSAIVRGSEATLVFDANLLRFARALQAAADQGEGPAFGRGSAAPGTPSAKGRFLFVSPWRSRDSRGQRRDDRCRAIKQAIPALSSRTPYCERILLIQEKGAFREITVRRSAQQLFPCEAQRLRKRAAK